MIVRCATCLKYFDDTFRWTFCPHATFAANDGQNQFAYHPESYLRDTEPGPALIEIVAEGASAECVAHALTVEFDQVLTETEWRHAVDHVRQLPHVKQLTAHALTPRDTEPDSAPAVRRP